MKIISTEKKVQLEYFEPAETKSTMTTDIRDAACTAEQSHTEL